MPEKTNGWRKVVIFLVSEVTVLLMTLFGGLSAETAADVIKYIALGFFAGNGIEHLGKLINIVK